MSPPSPSRHPLLREHSPGDVRQAAGGTCTARNESDPPGRGREGGGGKEGEGEGGKGEKGARGREGRPTNSVAEDHEMIYGWNSVCRGSLHDLWMVVYYLLATTDLDKGLASDNVYADRAR